MEKIERLAVVVISTLKRCDENFAIYWNNLSKLDKNEIMDELQDAIYDWTEING